MPQVNVTPDLLDGDLHVIGLEDNGDVILVQGSILPFTSGESLVQWGLHNLRKHEVERLLALHIREEDRKLLGNWYEGMTEEGNSELGIVHGYPL